MPDDPHKNEFDDLVRRAKGYHVRPLTPGEKAGVLWADAAIKRAGDIEKFIAKECLYDHPGDANIIGPKIRAYLLEGRKA